LLGDAGWRDGEQGQQGERGLHRVPRATSDGSGDAFFPSRANGGTDVTVLPWTACRRGWKLL
jgi:hypothetical protein